MYKFYKKIRLKIIPHRHYISGAEKFSLCEKNRSLFSFSFVCIYERCFYIAKNTRSVL